MEINVPQGHPFTFPEDSLETLLGLFRHYNIDEKFIDRTQNLCSLPRPYIGLIRLPAKTIVINPAQEGVKINHIIRMYFFVSDIKKNFSLNEVTYDLDDMSFEMDLSHEYRKELLYILRKGLPSRYREREISTNFLCGNVDLITTYGNILKKTNQPVVTSTDDITIENSLNIVLSAALWKIKDTLDHRDFVFLANKLPWAKSVDIDSYINKVSFDRSNSFCRRAFDLAVMILKEIYFSQLGESTKGESFVINYDKLFEDFVSIILIFLSNISGFTKLEKEIEYGVYVEEGYTYKKGYIPDLLFRLRQEVSTRALAVLDAKNKIPEVFTNPDVYQLIFYGKMLDCHRLVLIYPSVLYRAPMDLEIKLVEGGLSKIRAVFINITSTSHQDFTDSVLKFIEDIDAALK